MTTKSQEVVVLPCTSTLLQRPLGSQDGPVDGTVEAAGDFPDWLGCHCPPASVPSPERYMADSWGRLKAVGQP